MINSITRIFCNNTYLPFKNINQKIETKQKSQAMVLHSINPSTQDAETGRRLKSLRLAWSTKQILRHPGLPKEKETLSQRKREKKCIPKQLSTSQISIKKISRFTHHHLNALP